MGEEEMGVLFYSVPQWQGYFLPQEALRDIGERLEEKYEYEFKKCCQKLLPLAAFFVSLNMTYNPSPAYQACLF